MPDSKVAARNTTAEKRLIARVRAIGGTLASRLKLSGRTLAIVIAVLLLLAVAASVALQIRRDHAYALLVTERWLTAQVHTLSVSLAGTRNEAEAAQLLAASITGLPDGAAAGLTDLSGAMHGGVGDQHLAARAFQRLIPSSLTPQRPILHYVKLPDNGEAMLAAERIEGAPYVVALALPITAALSGWYGALPLYIMLIVGPAIVAALLALLLVQERQKADKARRRLKMRDGLLRDLANEAENVLATKNADIERERLRAEEAERVRAELLAAASHELRTPLNAILGFSEMMAEEIHGPVGHAKYLEYARDIRESGARLLELIERLLTAAKIERDEIRVTPEPRLAADTLRAAIAMVEGFAKNHGVEIETGFMLPARIVADETATEVAIAHVLLNAVKFSKPGTRVKIVLEPYENAVRISVHDTGSGIPAPQLRRLGQPFARASLTSGLGLGLAIAKSLIELQEGTLLIDSAPGRGTTVHIDLPAAA